MSSDQIPLPNIPSDPDAYPHRDCPFRDFDVRKGIFEMQHLVIDLDRRMNRLETRTEKLEARADTNAQNISSIAKEQSVWAAKFEEFRKALDEKLEGISDNVDEKLKLVTEKMSELTNSFSAKNVWGYVQMGLIILSTAIIILSNIHNLTGHILTK